MIKRKNKKLKKHKQQITLVTNDKSENNTSDK